MVKDLGLQKPALGWSLYLDANPVPTSPLADNIATTLSGPVVCSCIHVCVSLYVNRNRLLGLFQTVIQVYGFKRFWGQYF